MIKIELSDSAKAKEVYFTGVKELILPRAKLFRIAFDVMSGTSPVQELLDFKLPAKTKTALLKKLVVNTTPFANKSHHAAISNPAVIIPEYFNHRIEFAQLFHELSNEALLRSLILADIAQLKAQSLYWEKPWLNTTSHELVTATISYDAFTKKDSDSYNAYDLAELLDVPVCPYCNRIYTSTIITAGKKRIVRPTFDHFFHQALYPFLSLSFYNLVPSCNNCNSSLKGQTPFELHSHLHPYVEGFGDVAKFDFFFKALHADKSHPGNYHILLLEDSLAAKHPMVSGNIAVFEIREIYKSHADIVGEIAVKVDRNSPYYAGALFKSLPSFQATKREFYRFYFGNYHEEKDFNRRPLAKLTRDIVGKYLPELFS